MTVSGGIAVVAVLARACEQSRSYFRLDFNRNDGLDWGHGVLPWQLGRVTLERCQIDAKSSTIQY